MSTSELPPQGIDAVRGIIATCDEMALLGMQIEAEIAGPNAEPFPRDELLRFLRGVRGFMQDTATLMRFLERGIEAEIASRNPNPGEEPAAVALGGEA